MLEEFWKYILLLFCWTYTYDTDTPASSDDPKEGDNRIRETKDATREREDVDHYWPLMNSDDEAGGSEVAGTEAGQHRDIHLREKASLSAEAEGVPILGAKTQSNDGTDKPELTFKDEDGDEVQITKDGTNYDDPGVIKMYGGVIAPTGWLMCDGSLKAKVTYADLYTALGYTYGGSGDNFRLPDMRGRTPMGIGTGNTTPKDQSGDALTTRARGDYKGAETHTLEESEAPKHIHVGTTDDDAPHTHYRGTIIADFSGNPDWDENGGGAGRSAKTTSDGQHDHDFETDEQDSGDGEHNNIQPSVGVNFIIKI